MGSRPLERPRRISRRLITWQHQFDGLPSLECLRCRCCFHLKLNSTHIKHRELMSRRKGGKKKNNRTFKWTYQTLKILNWYLSSPERRECVPMMCLYRESSLVPWCYAHDNRAAVFICHVSKHQHQQCGNRTYVEYETHLHYNADILQCF